MRHGTCPGASSLDAICRAAPGDIRHRLWTLYWLARQACSQKESCKVLIELGTRQGDSTRALWAACLDADNDTMLVSFDIEDVQGSVIRRTRDLGLPLPMTPWMFRHMNSVEGGREWIDVGGGNTDFVFVDTDHTLETTRAEIAAWARHVRVGGLMVFHDYWLHDPARPESGHGVKMAVDEFADANRGTWLLETHDAVGDGDTGLALLWRLE